VHQDGGYPRVGLGLGEHAVELDPLLLALKGTGGLRELGHDLNALPLSVVPNLAELLRDGEPPLFLHVGGHPRPGYGLHGLSARTRNWPSSRADQGLQQGL
jgi:hypothetical protein